MTKKLYKILLAVLIGLSTVTASANTTPRAQGDVSVYSLGVKPADENKTFLTGEEIVFNLEAAISSQDPDVNKEIEIKIPKKGVVNVTVGSDSTQGWSGSVSSDATHHIIRISIESSVSGMILRAPFSVLTDKGHTPNGFEVEVTANLKLTNDTTVLASAQSSVTITTTPISILRQVEVQPGIFLVKQGSIVHGGYVDRTDPAQLSDQLNELSYVNYSYILDRSSDPRDLGFRYYDKVVLKEKLPLGAVFVQEDNIGWTYNAASRIATYTYTANEPFLLFYKSFSTEVVLKLKYPSFLVGSLVSGTVEFEAFPHNQESYEIPDTGVGTSTVTLSGSDWDAPKTFTGTKVAQTNTINDIRSVRSLDQRWRLYVKNTADPTVFPNSSLNDLHIRDFNLDPRLEYKALDFTVAYPNVKVDIIATLTDNTEHIVAANRSLDTPDVVSLTGINNIKSVSVKLTADSVIEPSETFEFYVVTQLKDKVSDILGADEASSNLVNSAEFTANRNDGTPYNKVVRNDMKIRVSKVLSTLSQTKNVINLNNNFYKDEIAQISLETRLGNFIAGETVFETNQIVDFIPRGTSYVPGSVSVTTTAPTAGIITNHEPQVVTNYKNTGLDALVWDLNSFTFDDPTRSGTVISTYSALRIQYSLKVSEYTDIGNNTTPVYLSWLNVDQIKPQTSTNSQAEDIYDLNGNSKTDDLIASRAASFNYIPPFGIVTRKEVKGSLDAQYKLPYEEGKTKFGETLKYRYTIFNNSNEDYSNLAFLDILPFIGDKKVSSEIIGGDVVRVNRGSQFAIRLTGPIVVPSNLVVLYTTDVDSEDVDAFYKNAQWTTSPTDFEAVTAFKVELKPGESFTHGSHIEFEAEFMIPYDAFLSNGLFSTNSYGVSVGNEAIAPDTNIDFFESNLSSVELIHDVTIRYITYRVDKEWDGGTKGTIELTLYQDGTVYDRLTLDEATGWSHLWSNLPDRDALGNLYTYSVEETMKPINYITEMGDEVVDPITGDIQLTITNKYEDLIDREEPKEPVDPGTPDIDKPDTGNPDPTDQPNLPNTGLGSPILGALLLIILGLFFVNVRKREEE